MGLSFIWFAIAKNGQESFVLFVLILLEFSLMDFFQLNTGFLQSYLAHIVVKKEGLGTQVFRGIVSLDICLMACTNLSLKLQDSLPELFVRTE